MELGEFIKERRAEIGMTQVRLAELLGRSASTVRSWERGATAPPEDLYGGLASALGVELDELQELAGVPAETTGADEAHREEVRESVLDVFEREALDESGQPATVGDEAERVPDGDGPSSGNDASTRDRAPQEVVAEPSPDIITQAASDGPDEILAEGTVSNPADDLLEQLVVGNPAESTGPGVDQTTVMAEGLAMSVPVASPSEAQAPEPLAQEDAPTDASGRDLDREDDTDESEVIEIDGAERSLRPRLLGTALSTDPLVEPEVTQVAAPYAATEMLGRRPTSTLAASPYPEARGGADIIPEDRGYIGDWTEQRTYQVRRILTVVGVLILFLMLRWSMGGFLDGFQTLKDSIMSNVNL